LSFNTDGLTATLKLYNDEKAIVSRLEEKLNYTISEQDLDNIILKGLYALSSIRQLARARIHLEFQKIMVLEKRKKEVKGPIYLRIIYSVIYLAAGFLFFMAFLSLSPSLIRLVPILLLISLCVALIGACIQYISEEIAREKIEKEINTIKVNVENFSQELWNEIEILLEKLAEHVRLKKKIENQHALKLKIRAYLEAYRDAKLEDIATKFKISVEQANNFVQELIREKAKGKPSPPKTSKIGMRSSNAKGSTSIIQKLNMLEGFCEYLSGEKCQALQDNVLLIERDCNSAIKDICCYYCQNRQHCDIACDILDSVVKLPFQKYALKTEV